VALLNVVERVAPEDLGERFRQVLAWRKNLTYGNESRALGRNGQGNRLRLSDPVLAAFVVRYNRSAARELLMPADDESLEIGGDETPQFFFGALACIDPAAALAAVPKLPETSNRERERKFKAWAEVTKALSLDADARWEWIQDRQYSLWIADRVDQ
jgi:hypothetical protein